MEIIKTDLKKLVSESNPKLSGNEYQIECPICKQLGYNYQKRKLYVKDDFSVGYCFRCGTKFKNKIDFNNIGNDFVFNISKQKPKEFNGEEKIDVKYYLESDDFNKTGVKYLESRRSWLKENYSELGIKFRNDRLIIPFFKGGDIKNEVIFYQCRFYDPEKSGKRYLIPSSTNKPIYLSPNGNNNSKIMILCEGPFGAISISNSFPEYKCGAVMGSNISDYQLYLLSKMEITHFILYFDNEEINKKAKKILSERFPFCSFISLKSPCGDPEDDLINNLVPKINLKEVKSLLTDSVINFISKVDISNKLKPYEKKEKKYSAKKAPPF